MAVVHSVHGPSSTGLPYCTASSSGRQPNFDRGGHLCSAGRPSRWALAHILVCSCVCFCCVRFSFFSTINQEIGWEEPYLNVSQTTHFCVECNVKPQPVCQSVISHNASFITTSPVSPGTHSVFIYHFSGPGRATGPLCESVSGQ